MFKIVYIVQDPYSKRDHNRFGAEYLMEQGYSVEIWRIVFKTSIQYPPNVEIYENNNYLEMNYKSFKKRIKKENDILYFLLNSKTLMALDIIKGGYKYIIAFGFGGIVSESPIVKENLINRYGFFENSFIRKIRTVKSIGVKKTFAVIKKRAINSAIQNRAKRNLPLFVATSTKHVAKSCIQNVFLEKNVIYIHSWDYDRYIESNRKKARKEKHIVFCDTGLITRSYDYELNNIESELTKNKEYCFEQLEQIFKVLENYYNVPVIVAGHPHARYCDGDFSGREIVIGRTCDLVRDAKLFIVDVSTATSFSLLYNVPQLRYVNNMYKKVFISPERNLFDAVYQEADVLGCKVINLDNKADIIRPWEFITCVDINKKMNYISHYIIDSDVREMTIVECIDESIKKFGFYR